MFGCLKEIKLGIKNWVSQNKLNVKTRIKALDDELNILDNSTANDVEKNKVFDKLQLLYHNENL